MNGLLENYAYYIFTSVCIGDDVSDVCAQSRGRSTFTEAQCANQALAHASSLTNSIFFSVSHLQLCHRVTFCAFSGVTEIDCECERS